MVVEEEENVPLQVEKEGGARMKRQESQQVPIKASVKQEEAEGGETQEGGEEVMAEGGEEEV